jgi:hypothetical protein
VELTPSSLTVLADGYDRGMFLFFSNRLGCFGSLMLSLAITAVLILLLSR